MHSPAGRSYYYSPFKFFALYLVDPRPRGIGIGDRVYGFAVRCLMYSMLAFCLGRGSFATEQSSTSHRMARFTGMLVLPLGVWLSFPGRIQPLPIT